MTVRRPVAPAAERNATPILELLQQELRDVSSVLEIGSGTGQHAVLFAKSMPWLTWQTSDLAVNHDGINAWIDHTGSDNLLRPFALDVTDPRALANNYDAVFSANTAHIMSVAAVEAMFAVVARALRPGGLFCLYGPFNWRGEFTSESNRQFDASLRNQDADMGIRDLQRLDGFAGDHSMARVRLYAMPANNHVAVFQCAEARVGGK